MNPIGRIHAYSDCQRAKDCSTHGCAIGSCGMGGQPTAYCALATLAGTGTAGDKCVRICGLVSTRRQAHESHCGQHGGRGQRREYAGIRDYRNPHALHNSHKDSARNQLTLFAASPIKPVIERLAVRLGEVRPSHALLIWRGLRISQLFGCLGRDAFRGLSCALRVFGLFHETLLFLKISQRLIQDVFGRLAEIGSLSRLRHISVYHNARPQERGAGPNWITTAIRPTPYCAVYPPSTTSSLPVMNDASSEHRTNDAKVILWGRPKINHSLWGRRQRFVLPPAASSHGLTTGTPTATNGAVSRVATANPCTAAIAAI
jgi:hypothetical protein